MRKSIFWAIFYMIIAATLYICVIFGDPGTMGYKTSQYSLLLAIIISIVDIYWIRKAVTKIMRR